MLLFLIHHFLRLLFHYAQNHNNSIYFIPTIIDGIYNSFYHGRNNYIIIFAPLIFWETEVFRYKKWISTLLAYSSITLDWLRHISGCASLQADLRLHHVVRHLVRLYVKPTDLSSSILNPLHVTTSQRIEDSREEQIANIKFVHMCLMNSTSAGRPGVGAMLLRNSRHHARGRCSENRINGALAVGAEL